MLLSTFATTALASLALADRVKLKVVGENIDKYVMKPMDFDPQALLMVGDYAYQFEFSHNSLYDTEYGKSSEVRCFENYLVYDNLLQSSWMTFLVNSNSELVTKGHFHLCKVFSFYTAKPTLRSDEPGIRVLDHTRDDDECTPVTIKVEVVAQTLELAAVTKGRKTAYRAKDLSWKREENSVFYLGESERPTVFEHEGNRLILPVVVTDHQSGQHEYEQYNLGIDNNYMVMKPGVQPLEVEFDDFGIMVTKSKIWLCCERRDLPRVNGCVVMVGEREPGSECTRVSIYLRNASDNFLIDWNSEEPEFEGEGEDDSEHDLQ